MVESLVIANLSLLRGQELRLKLLYLDVLGVGSFLIRSSAGYFLVHTCDYRESIGFLLG